MKRRTAAYASMGLVLFGFWAPQALAEAGTDPLGRNGAIQPAAALDTTFGDGGFVTLPGEVDGQLAIGAETASSDIIASGGSNLRLLTNSGGPADIFGGAGTLSPQPPRGGEFSLSDFTLDAGGRLLVLGTSRFPIGDPETPPPPVEPSAVRVFRFLSDGRPDPTFGQNGVVETDFGLSPPSGKNGKALLPSASMEATGITVDSQGRIVVTGGADIGLGPSCHHDIFEPVALSVAFVARLTETGALDSSFGGDGLVGGRKPSETPLRAATVGDPVTGPSGAVTFRSTAINPCASGHGRSGVAQLTPEGKPQERPTKKSALDGEFTALAAEPDGSVVAVAMQSQPGGEAARARVIRIDPEGRLDRSFGRNGRTNVKLGNAPGNQVNALAVDPQGRILLGGTLASYRRRRAANGKLGSRSIWLVRLRADGRPEASFGPNGRVATLFPGLSRFGPSDLFFDPEGRVVTVHRYEAHGEITGLLIARYLLRN